MVTAQEHVVMQRPMPSPEQATSTARPAAAAAAVLAPERKSAERNPPERKKERERGGDLVTERRMRMQWEGDVAESARRQKQTGQAV